MFAPKLYTVRKFNFSDLYAKEFNLHLDEKEERRYHIKQQDNMLFRQIRIITQNRNTYNPYVIFVDCKGAKTKEDGLSEIIKNGFYLNDIHFVLSERSASMTRNFICSFVDESIAEELNRRISMDIEIDKTVLSKYYAYRGLMFSSCHCLEEWYPKIVIVPDYFTIIPNQKIKYVYDEESTFKNDKGEDVLWKQKAIGEKVTDIKINAFDGCGIHHPLITAYVQEHLRSKTRPTSILWRMPWIKGVTHEVNYSEFYHERGVNEITDVWGIKHSVDDVMIIMGESMYKGIKYFQKDKDYHDWERYWEKFKKYDHCIGVAKWNFSKEEEPAYTRGNYQIFQDLDLSYYDFSSLARKSFDWITRIIEGEDIHTYCFLGLMADNCEPLNDYVAAILKNPEVLKDSTVRNYMISLMEKYIDEMKCGKLWIDACFKFLVPDLIMFMEAIGGLEPKGFLAYDEFYSTNRNGVLEGEYLIERNPHICSSEHVVLNGVKDKLAEKYFGGLDNICMINCKSITPQRLNGADFDGDLVLVINEPIMKKGVHLEKPIVIDIEDKITSLAEKDTPENRLALVKRTMNSLIGETSNCATGFINKTPKSEEQRKKYEEYVNLLSIINGKAINKICRPIW